MRVNTVKTTLGYLRSLFEKYSGISWKARSLSGIYNYHAIELSQDVTINTSGQPTKTQFAAIKALGVNTVINLAPSSAENCLSDEAQVVTQLGMNYIHLPVDFKAPTENDFQRFVGLLNEAGANTNKNENTLNQIWVHCAANMRVSAFIYRYRCEHLGHSEATAKKDMDVIWEPFGVWRTFVSSRSD